MNLSNCIFFQCSCTVQGGSIYFFCNNLGTNVELNNICINYCFSGLNNWYQFGVIQTHLNSNNNNNFISIINCNKISNSYCSFRIYNGNINFNNFNSSNNYNKCYSSFSIIFPTKLNSNFCNIINNYVSEYANIQLWENQNNYLSNYNIINNNDVTHGVVTNWGGIYFINNSIFLNNINTLFFSLNGLLNIINCKIYHPQIYSVYSNSNTGSIFTLNNINQLTNTFFINHFFTYKCESINKFTLKNKFKNNFLLTICLFSF